MSDSKSGGSLISSEWFKYAMAGAGAVAAAGIGHYLYRRSKSGGSGSGSGSGGSASTDDKKKSLPAGWIPRGPVPDEESIVPEAPSPKNRLKVVVVHGDPSKPNRILPGGWWDDDDYDVRTCSLSLSLFRCLPLRPLPPLIRCIVQPQNRP